MRRDGVRGVRLVRRTRVDRSGPHRGRGDGRGRGVHGVQRVQLLARVRDVRVAGRGVGALRHVAEREPGRWRGGVVERRAPGGSDAGAPSVVLRVPVGPVPVQHYRGRAAGTAFRRPAVRGEHRGVPAAARVRGGVRSAVPAAHDAAAEHRTWTARWTSSSPSTPTRCPTWRAPTTNSQWRTPSSDRTRAMRARPWWWPRAPTAFSLPARGPAMASTRTAAGVA